MVPGRSPAIAAPAWQARALGRREVLRLDAEKAAQHAAVLDQVLHDPGREVGRNRESDALRPAVERGVDADEVTVRVDQRAARVAGVDRGVRLHEVLDRVQAEVVAPGRADDALRDRLAEAIRIADREHDIADAHVADAREVDAG